ncbi:hypothetical protein D3C80_1742070 [compost metagenome]
MYFNRKQSDSAANSFLVNADAVPTASLRLSVRRFRSVCFDLLSIRSTSVSLTVSSPDLA